MMPEQQLLPLPPVESLDVDLDEVDRVTYLLEHTFRYDYPEPVRQLRHRLLVLPPTRHGGQYLRARRLDVQGADARRMTRQDTHGNTVLRLQVDRVDRSVQFQLRALVERVAGDGPARLPAAAMDDPLLLRPTRLTAPDTRLRGFAEELRLEKLTPVELAGRICQCVYAAMAYEHDVTSIHTTAAEAFALGRGVCQDSAHVMLALCYLLAVPARYVSGHLIGQGGTHAWVEVVTAHQGEAVALPFDPCHGKPANARYLTVATGRDYTDVPPTSGSYLGAARGRLTTDRRVAVVTAA